ncbi:DUF2079 domain-containing protein [Catellatospora sp. KI3]|uniref:DUF6541 family protein n=1 Tax=Catellatospora sp. KI3 TaxID=3041620 RepID=UPI0024832D85|nr:DUF6541 family protein [Catellatospora sp. KI3]MDI1465545.1 DUF2079 domain-containing protein [Catellatospora sp. KI3]
MSLLIAVWVTGALWADPAHRASGVNSGDQAFFEWLLSYGAYAVTHGADPLFTHLLNVPDGVNLAVNTSITVYAVAFAPLTILAGPTATFLAILTLNLALSAFAWYRLFARHLGAAPWAAAVGGLFCGFAPAMISHANAHLNWTAQWVIPLIIGRCLLLIRRGRPVRDGAILGLLIAVCFSIAAEALFFTALALGVFTLVWALSRRAETRTLLRPALTGLGTAALVAGALLAYPLWLHFLGPQGYHGTGFDPKVHNEDLAAYAAWPERSIAGALGLNAKLAANPTEENSFFGAPLLLLVIVGLVLLWRRADRAHRATLRGLAVVAGVFTVLSLGPELRWLGRLTGTPMPEALVGGLPVFNAALPSRLALIVAPVFGLLLAWLGTTLTRHRAHPATAEPTARPADSGPAADTESSADTAATRSATPGRPLPGPRWAWLAAFAVALVPLFPTQLSARDRAPVPHFFADGTWRQYVADGGTVVPVPITNDLLPDGQRWQAAALADAAGAGEGVFRLPAGFFLGPGGPNGTGRIGPIPRPTQTLLEEVAKTGTVPPIGEAERAALREDLRYWHGSIVVLADDVHGAHWPTYQPALLQTMTALLGAPERVDDVWLWRTPA